MCRGGWGARVGSGCEAVFTFGALIGGANMAAYPSQVPVGRITPAEEVEQSLGAAQAGTEGEAPAETKAPAER
jgi:hypothetical protein